MSLRKFPIRPLFLLTLGIGTAIVILVAVGLAVSGMFSPVWFARAIFITALVVGGIELLMIPRTLRVSYVRGHTATWRQTDRSQGCTVLLLGALITMGLFACGSLMVWWLELR